MMVKNLKKLRSKKGVSQRELANAVMVSQQSINKYENHDVEPDISTLIKMADYFNVSLDYLVGREYCAKDVDGTQIAVSRSDIEELKSSVESFIEKYTD